MSQKAGGLVAFTSQVNAGEMSGETVQKPPRNPPGVPPRALPLEWPSSQPKESGHLPFLPSHHPAPGLARHGVSFHIFVRFFKPIPLLEMNFRTGTRVFLHCLFFQTIPLV